MLVDRIWRWMCDERETLAPEPEPVFIEQRAEPRVPVFKEAVIAIEGFYHLRVVITDLVPGGARIRFTHRIDLPSRIVIMEPTLRLNGWARVVWQDDGVAGLQFLPEPERCNCAEEQDSECGPDGAA